jgi:hypothetical protein
MTLPSTGPFVYQTLFWSSAQDQGKTVLLQKMEVEIKGAERG